MNWYGSEYGRWMIDEIRHDDVVYSVGVGRDYTWDAEVADRFGCTIHLFDPTPDSISYCTDLPARLVFHPVGIGATAGDVPFYHHVNPAFQTRSMVPGGQWRGEPEFVARVITLWEAMEMCGHDRIDVLKLCLGGDLEYDVVMSMIGQAIWPRTLCFLALHMSGEKKDDVSRKLKDRGYTKANNGTVEPERWTWTCGR